jgi:hypothetical protein
MDALEWLRKQLDSDGDDLLRGSRCASSRSG